MPTFLIVEDTLDLARLIQRELEDGGYTVCLAADGLAALNQVECAAPDLVILDWMLPGLDGLEVLRRLRQTSQIPVLMLTARGEAIDRVVGLESGADDYLSKPFNLMELVARVRALLRRTEQVRAVLAADRAAENSALQYRSLRLDPQAYQASLDGAPLELTHREFELLHLLLRFPGRTFNRNYLLDTIWNQPCLESDRSVDNAILRLRKKLGALGDEIETVRGVGYRLRPQESRT
jgi:DNA-binding response OmpR family regulator